MRKNHVLNTFFKLSFHVFLQFSPFTHWTAIAPKLGRSCHKFYILTQLFETWRWFDVSGRHLDKNERKVACLQMVEVINSSFDVHCIIHVNWCRFFQGQLMFEYCSVLFSLPSYLFTLGLLVTQFWGPLRN